MFKSRPLLLLSVLLIIALTACNLPSGDGTSTPDLALTVTAQATLLQFTSTPEFTSTPGPSATPGFTSTPTVPEVTVSTNTNCRTGPGTQYDLIGGLNVGQTAIVVGKNSSTNYWIINNPGKSGTCWLWGEYATVSGNTAGLTEYSIPPTPTPSPTSTPTSTPTPPTAASNLVAAKVCVPQVAPIYLYGGVINWQDNSNNETGFNIYLNGALSGSTEANVTTYPIPAIPLAAGTPITMSVEAFNSGGKSAKVDVIIICP
ncbi:MAG: hypothetical protein HYZ21_06145 [Chloroflexi bacterium]|nr:hypothetical protein [Chloroflexota bacterium]